MANSKIETNQCSKLNDSEYTECSERVVKDVGSTKCSSVKKLLVSTTDVARSYYSYC